MPKRKRWVIVTRSRMFAFWSLGLSYAGKNGGPVLVEQAHWTNWRAINGIRVYTPWRQVWVLFRRRFW